MDAGDAIAAEQVVAGADLEPALGRQRDGQQQRVGRLALDLDPPARRLRPDVPFAAAGAGDRAGEGRGERDEAVGRPGDDRGRRDAVDPPARERDALALAPPPVVGERGAPVLLGVDAARRRRLRSPKRPVTVAPSRCGAQYWPSHGSICAGPSGPNGRRGQPRASSKRACRPGPRSTCSSSRGGAQVGRGVDAEAVAVEAHGLGDRGVLAAGLGGERDHRPVAADAGDRADAPAGAGEAPVVALEGRAVGAARVAERAVGAERALSERSRRG